MTTVKQLAFSPCASVANKANRQINIEFRLDRENTQRLLNKWSEKGFDELNDAIQTAAIYAVSDISQDELEGQVISSEMKTGSDPRNRSVFFAFQIMAGDMRNQVLITKAEVYDKPEQRLIIEYKLSLAKAKVVIDEDREPIIISFKLDERSIEHLKAFEAKFCTVEQADRITLEIPRAVGQGVYDRIKNKPTLPERIAFITKDPLSENSVYKYQVVCHKISENTVEIRQIRIGQVS